MNDLAKLVHVASSLLCPIELYHCEVNHQPNTLVAQIEVIQLYNL